MRLKNRLSPRQPDIPEYRPAGMAGPRREPPKRG